MNTTTQMPKLYDHAVKFYKIMEDGADGHGIFEGSIVAAFDEVRASRTYYSKLRNFLIESGCIEIERKGVTGSPSRVKMIHLPTEEDFDKTYTRRLTKRRHRDSVQLEQRVSNIEGRLGDSDIASALVDLETRMKRLEKFARTGR